MVYFGFLFGPTRGERRFVGLDENGLKSSMVHPDQAYGEQKGGGVILWIYVYLWRGNPCQTAFESRPGESWCYYYSK